MEELSGHQSIYAGRRTNIDLAFDKLGRKFVIKRRSSERSSKGLSNEFKVQTLLDQGHSFYEVKSEEEIFVRNYYEGSSLKDYIQKNEISFKSFLHIAIKICQDLQRIHTKGYIHTGLSTYNVVINPITLNCHIIDFEHVYRLESVQKGLVFETGNSNYVSPELREKDLTKCSYAADYYALGVVLYELVAGKLPFDTSSNQGKKTTAEIIFFDKIELIRNDFPKIIKDVIIKLVKENPEERYRSLESLEYDLITILNQFEKMGRVDRFPLDQVTNLRVTSMPQNLIGRGIELEEIKDFYSRLNTNTKLLLNVHGGIGVGKTFLVETALASLPKQTGLIVKGQFFITSIDSPYFAWRSILKGIIDYFLSQDSKVFKRWEEEMRIEMQGMSSTLVELLSQFSLVFDSKSVQEELDVTENLNRTNYVFMKLLKLVSKYTDGPLVIVLDNYQWCDSASHDLMNYMLNDPSIKNIFFVRLSRDNENLLDHNFDELLSHGVYTKTLIVDDLNEENFKELVAEVFNGRLDQFDEFCTTVFAASKGNPEFLSHALKLIVSSELLTLSRGSLKWIWEAEKVEEYLANNTLKSIIQKRFDELEERVQDFLIRLSVFGSSVNKLIFSHCFADFQNVFDTVVKELLLIDFVTTDSVYVNGVTTSQSKYRIKSDVVSQVILSGVSTESIQQIHLQVARNLCRLRENTKPYHVFEICRHYSNSSSLVDSKIEKELLFNFYFEAIQVAQKNAAYATSYHYLNLSLQIFNEEWWDTHFSRCFQFYFKLIEVESVLGMDQKLEEHKSYLLSKSISREERLKIMNVSIQYYRNARRFDDAIEVAIEACGLFGLKLKKSYSKFEVIRYILLITFTLKTKKANFILEQKMSSEGEWYELSKAITSVAIAAYFITPSILPVLVYLVGKIVLKSGNNDYTIQGFASYAAVLSGRFNDFKNGQKFKDVALELTDKFQPVTSSKVYFLTSFSLHWEEHLREALPGFKKAYESGMKSGDLEYAAYALFGYNQYSFFAGDNLIKLEHNLIENRAKIKFFKEETILFHHQMYGDLISILSSKKSLKDKFEDQDFISTVKRNNKTTLFTYYYLRLFLAFLFKERSNYDFILKYCETYKEGSRGNYSKSFYMMIQALCIYDGLKNNELSSGYSGYLLKIQNEFEVLTEQCPQNYENKLEMLKALRLGLTQKYSESRKHIDQAIELSRQQGFIYEEAMFWQISADMLIDQDRSRMAGVFLQKSFDCYKRWGAQVVVEELKQQYSFYFIDVLDEAKSKDSNAFVLAPNLTKLAVSSELKNIITASEEILSETDQKRLLNKLLKYAVSWTNAKRGIVLLNQTGNLFIKCIVDSTSGYSSDDEDVLMRDCGLLSEQVVQSCSKLLKSILLYDASSDERFSKDDYVSKFNSKSILCTPIVYENTLQGVLYLEDNDAVGAFSRDKLELCQIFSKQVSITLKNVRRYVDQENILISRSQELESINAVVLENNRQIKSSIRYALHIQNSILPTHATFSSYFTDFFIYYQPRDIVSGDFYWITKAEGKIVLAAIDCTGHGVPGAFMSMIGNSILNNIVNEKKIVDPALILDQLHIRVQKTLNQKETLNMDGMDAAVVVIDYDSKVVEFAGANNPLFYTSGDSYFILEGNKHAVGGIDDRVFEGFTNHTLRMIEGMQLYIFSDGFQDQMGGPKNKKFMKKNFRNLLFNISKFPLTQQENLLKSTFESWRGDNDTMDDVMVLGVKI